MRRKPAPVHAERRAARIVRAVCCQHCVAVSQRGRLRAHLPRHQVGNPQHWQRRSLENQRLPHPLPGVHLQRLCPHRFSADRLRERNIPSAAHFFQQCQHQRAFPAMEPRRFFLPINEVEAGHTVLPQATFGGRTYPAVLESTSQQFAPRVLHLFLTKAEGVVAFDDQYGTLWTRLQERPAPSKRPPRAPAAGSAVSAGCLRRPAC